MRILGPTQKKVLLLLMSGVGLGLSGSPTQYFRILKYARKEWKNINRQNLSRTVRRLYQAKLVTEKLERDGSVSLVLTPEGRKRIRQSEQKIIRIKKPPRWDEKWRVVLFDVPEEKRSLRDIFRRHLQGIGFREFQKSVFIFPYECEREIASLIKLYDAKEYFQYLLVFDVSDARRFRKIFSLK